MSHPAASVRRGALGLLAAATLLAGCTNDQRNPLAPIATKPTSRAGTSLTCTVQVKAASLSCAATASIPAARTMALTMLGGQDSYVRLTSSGTVYDAGTGILSSDVTVQNLVQTALGTPDGTSVTGVMVFFNQEPVVTSGSGSVSVVEDGRQTFLTTNQPYLMYNQKLEPFEISQSRTWSFNVQSTVSTFSFQVYVAADVVDPSAPMLDAVWSGAKDSAWSDTLNWAGGKFPSDTAIVAIPSDSLLASHVQPVLVGDVMLGGVRVGYGSTLDLGGHVLSASRNVDALGSITNGTVQLTGSQVVLGGNLNAVQVTGSAKLQRATVASGAVTVMEGSLAATDRVLSIVIP